ncbi:MAG: hypothetical protein K0U90_05615 [Planctomycetes bacterium]|nr:hypothetical protein [Gammaproteobacteria bacterium]MCH9775895.1 hypothetical protein [Planctomycetota bacterium]
MNLNVTLFDQLISYFRELSNLQEGDDLSNVLLEFVDPKICVKRFVHPKDYPQRWSFIPTLDKFTIVINTDERIFESLIIPYCGNNLISTDKCGDIPLPDKFTTLRKRLIDNLELAGRELLRHPISQSLPLEITRCRNPAQSWLFFLHYIIKPERKTWIRTNRVIALGYDFGVIDCDEEYLENLDSVPLDMDRYTTVGDFSFDILPKNSYSRIRDIANSSIEAIHRIKSGSEETSINSLPQGSKKPLMERYEKAYRSYEFAESSMGLDCTDEEAYRWLEENCLCEYELPSYQTWSRYLRVGRKHYGTNKNTPIAGRAGRFATPAD